MQVGRAMCALPQWNHELLRSCEICERVKRPRCTKTGVGAATQMRTAPTSTLAPLVTPVAPPANVGMGAAPAEMEEICLPAPAESLRQKQAFLWKS